MLLCIEKKKPNNNIIFNDGRGMDLSLCWVSGIIVRQKKAFILTISLKVPESLLATQ